MKQHFAMFAAYNHWANATVFEACGTLSHDAFVHDTGAAFGSAMRTLNHLLATDRIWMKRFTGEGSAPTSLDAILFEQLDDLRAARQTEDRRIIDWVDRLDDDALGGTISYSPLTGQGQTVSQRLGPALAHLFNHQTHHRGQLHGILTTLGQPSPVLDLVYFQRTGEGRAFA
ncbi:damage-inducible protein DinB [Salmonella enterica subsp. enterica serovar Java]|nr:damage-inducible protein DinB [Salmonella enterica subsp. enterica serovar Java]